MGYEIAKLSVHLSSAAYSPIKDMFSYLNNKAKYVRDLEEGLIRLTVEMTTCYSRKKQVDRVLETALSKEKSDEYHILLKQIEVFQMKYDKFIKKYDKHCKNLPSITPQANVSSASSVIDAIQSRNPTILTRKFFTLASIGKDVKKLHGHVSRVTNRMKQENAMLEKGVQPVQVKHDDVDLPSFGEYVNKVLRHLCEDENNLVGIVGPIGVGKTTVMKKLNNQLKDTSSLLSNGSMNVKFDIVIWISYSKQVDGEDKNIEMMQDVIMERLKINKEKANSIEQNADVISTALKDKKYVLLIDQVSLNIDLNEVGIHKEHEFGKVVVASCSNKVIRQMTDQHVEIRPLSKDDAFNLFQKNCGMIYDPRIKDTADKIIESCGGLPLVIKLVATYLKGEKDESVWIYVKRMLQSDSKAKLLKLGGVGNAYKLVYDKLEKSHMKCLLFVALFPNDQKVYKDYLVECWNAETFLDSGTPKLRSARECGATVLKELTDQYLLEQCSDKYVKMPVYFRKVALEQQYPDEENCEVWVPEKNNHFSAETWKTTRRMSLICSKPQLPESPESHNVSTLLLQLNPELVMLGDLFFRNMQNLRILDLNQTGIKSLPNSISSLINLISLYLNDCSRLDGLPREVKMLKKLEVLDIRGTLISRLPVEISEMFQLKCLRISFASKGCNRNRKGKEVEMKIPLNIIRQLVQLEELTIETGCCFQGWTDIADEIADELSQLKNLSSLSFHFPGVCSLSKFLVGGKSLKNTDTHRIGTTFRSFQISIGCCEMNHPYGSDISGILSERRLQFSTSPADNEEISSVKAVLSQASAFEFVGHSHLESLSELNLENAGSLKACILERCSNLKAAVNAKKSDGAVLQCLERLHLFDLRRLQCVWKGSVAPGSLSNLKVLTLCSCPDLTEILNHELAKALSSLKHLKVEDCSKVVEIVKVQSSEREDISEQVDLSDILHKVKTIELVNLPELRSVCSNRSIQWNSLRKIAAKGCRNLRNLSLTLSNAEKLEEIKCEASWWNALELPEEEEQRFLRLCDFVALEQPGGEGSSIHEAPASDNSSSSTALPTSNAYGSEQDTSNRNGISTSKTDARLEIRGESLGNKIPHGVNFVSSSRRELVPHPRVK